MFRVQINSQDVDILTDGNIRFTDLVELIKATIDPDHMITSLNFDGRELTDQEWDCNANQITAQVLQVSTGSPGYYVNQRLKEASGVVKSCFLGFREARKEFQDGDTLNGNKKLRIAVDNLKAFFEWYGTLTQLVPESGRQRLDISPQVREISEVCKKICQQQVYQSWWALGESLEKDLEPRLDNLEDVCRRVARTADSAAA